MHMLFKRILPLLLSALLIFCVGAFAEAANNVDPNPAEAENAESAAEGDASDTSPQPAPGYVLVTAGGQMGWLPLPEEGEYSVPIRLTQPDGTETENLVHLTPEGVYMEDSTCENHDCVEQGEVTLSNMQDRILGNMIICLPNQVTLQLFTPEELLEMFKGEGAEPQK